MSRFRCVDLFCGGGGTSTGMIEAFRKAGDECSLVGINHWQVAIDTNRRNHDGKWLCASVDAARRPATRRAFSFRRDILCRASSPAPCCCIPF